MAFGAASRGERPIGESPGSWLAVRRSIPVRAPEPRRLARLIADYDEARAATVTLTAAIREAGVSGDDPGKEPE